MSISTKNAPQQKSALLAKTLLAALLIMMALFAPGVARAAEAVMGLDITKIPPLKPIVFLSQEEFEKQTKLETEEAPYNDPYLPYEVRIPKGWTENVQGGIGELKNDDKVLSESVLAIIGKYIAPPKNLVRSQVLVEAVNLTYEVSLRDWFLNFILKNGFSLTAFTQKNEKELEAIYIQVIDDQTYSVRSRAIINGSRLIMIRYYLPQDNLKDEQQQRAQVIASFKLTSPSQERIEKQLEYAFLDQSYFNYPASWTLQAKTIYSIERMTAQIYKKMGEKEKESLFGQIKVNVVSRLLNTSLADELKKFRQDAAVEGYSVGKLIEKLPYKYDASIKSGRTEAYQLVPRDRGTMKSYEFVVTILQNDDFYYIASLITPSRDQDFYVWSRNMEAFRIVSETMRRGNLPNVQVDPNDPYYDYLKEQ